MLITGAFPHSYQHYFSTMYTSYQHLSTFNKVIHIIMYTTKSDETLEKLVNALIDAINSKAAAITNITDVIKQRESMSIQNVLSTPKPNAYNRATKSGQ